MARFEFGMISDDGGWGSSLSYPYSVNGDFYSGVFPIEAKNEKQADEHVRAWKGQSIVIRSSARDPAISVVLQEDQASLLAEASGKR